MRCERSAVDKVQTQLKAVTSAGSRGNRIRPCDRAARDRIRQRNELPGKEIQPLKLRRLKDKVPHARRDFQPTKQFRLHRLSPQTLRERVPPAHRSAPDARRVAPSLGSPFPGASRATLPPGAAGPASDTSPRSGNTG